MTAYGNMHRTAFLMLSGLLVSFFILSYTVGFQSDIFSRSLYYFLQVSLSLAYLIVLKRKNPSIESSQVFKQGVVFAFAISLLMLLFILLCEFFSILPIIEMLYDGYTDTMIHFFERAVDHEKVNQQIKSGLSPTFLLTFVIVGSFFIGAAVSIFFYLILKNTSKWSYH